MPSIVREEGRKVVIRLAVLEASTARNRNRCHGLPNTGSARSPKTFSALAGLPSPMPSVPVPAYIWVAVATMR